MAKYANKVAVVTGAASGIGRSLAQELARRGARVVVADINGEGAAAVAREIEAAGGKASWVRLDVTDESEVAGLIHKTVADHGRIDFLFNNAGIGVGGEARDLTLAQWRRIVDVNLWGVIYGCHAAYPIMIRQGSGHIVNTASVAGLAPLPGEVCYATTKFAVVGLSTALRNEAAGLGVKVSVVCPGFIDTAIFETAEIAGADPKDILERLPRKFFATADQAAREILAGVSRNKDIIIVTLHGKLVVGLYRLSRPLWSAVNRIMMRDYRKIRKSAA
ncbi:MAG: SDR family NAD(P)-dependent oxidoreductase [Thermodesulfobacteriota bacterium]